MQNTNNEENLSKSPISFREEAVLEFWKENNIFEKTLNKEKNKGEFVFYEGPPTANGKPGIHHLEARSFKDIIPRYKTMRGYHVMRRGGWDTHGLPVELQVEKMLGLKSKKEIEEYGIEEFNKKCRESVWDYLDMWNSFTARMGYWVDMQNPYVTYQNSYIEALWGVVGRANERGHLYKDFKVLPWCTRCGTALSSHELNQPGAYKDVKDLSVYVKFKIVGVENGYFLAWTTTPWTLPGNVGLAVGNDIDYVEAKIGNEVVVVAKERISVLGEGYEIIAEHKGSEMVGMQYEPLYPYLSELITEDQKLKLPNAYKVYAAEFVTTTDGTGIVHTAVMYGADDFELGTKYNLPKFHTVNEEGKFIPGTGFLEGRYVKETDEKGKPTLAVDIIDDLTARGLLFKKENHMHSYPHCWRCDTPLLYYARSSWYFRMSSLRQQLLDANKNINWEPEHIKEGRFGEWLDGIRDWALSRDRYWGTPLPVWEKTDGGYVVIDSLEKIKKHSKSSGNKYFVMRHGLAHSNVANVWSCKLEDQDRLTDKGVEQVKNSANSILENKIDVIITSPFLRTLETAKIVASVVGVPEDQIITDNRIVEWNVGTEFDGKPIENYFNVRNLQNDRYGFKTEDGESYADVLVHVGGFMYDIESKYKDKNILIVCHGGPARAVELVTAGYSLSTLFKDTRGYKNFDNAEVRQINFVPLPHNENFELDLHKPFIDNIELVDESGNKMTRTKEVMDVWFDSGAMPYAQGHVLGSGVDFNPAPADYISEAIDQTRGWFYTLHAVSNMLSDTPRPAYKNVICLGHILDSQGLKMSKSKGNVVDPWTMFDKYGADTLRLWMYSVNQPGDSKNFDEKTVSELHGKVFTLLDNCYKLFELYKDKDYKPNNTSNNVLDQWVLARLNQLISESTKSLDEYNIFNPVRALREFVADFSTWYIRRSRDRFKSDDVSVYGPALSTTHYVFTELAKFMAPFAPFYAEDLWQKVHGEGGLESVHLADWPKEQGLGSRGQVLENMQKVRDICTEGNALRKKSTIPVRQPLLSITVVSENLDKEYEEIIKDELNVKQVLYGSEFNLDTNITDELKQEGDYRELVRLVQDARKAKGLQPADSVNLKLPEQYRDTVAFSETDFKKVVGAHTIEFGGVEVIIEK
ncbi:MAG: class I tRNA ligase family protein [Minisyncoccia bacterium]